MSKTFIFTIKQRNKENKVQQNLAFITITLLIYLVQSFLLSKICREMAKKSLRYLIISQNIQQYNLCLLNSPVLKLICELRFARVRTWLENLHKL